MVTIKELPKNSSGAYLYDVLVDGALIHQECYYDDALELADTQGQPVEIINLSGNKVDFEAELKAKREMDAKGW